jgi:DHA2 family multidrug resistance protein
MRKFDLRLMVGVGISIFATSCFMDLYLDPNVAGPQLFVSDVVRAIGQALAMTPLSAVAMVGISKEEAGDASGLFNMTRNLGGAIGTAALETYFTKREQYHSFIINAHVSLYDPATQSRLAGLQHYFMLNGSANLADAMGRAVDVVGATIKAQATIMGYADCFGLLGAVMMLTVLSVTLLKRGTGGADGAH